MNYIVTKVIGVYDKKKDGSEYRSAKTGDVYKMASVNFNDKPEIVRVFVWGNQTIEVDMQYSGEIETGEYNGKPQYTFKGSQVVDKNVERMAKIEFSIANTNQKLDEIIKYLKTKPWIVVAPTTSKGEPMPDFDPATNPNIKKEVTFDEFLAPEK
jgi:adenylate cyclase class IV